MEKTFLILADGTRFEGTGKGFAIPTASDLADLSPEQAPCGEVVFNTTMGAYHEILTDASYAGQIIVMTCPHIGNYGSSPDWNETVCIPPPCRALIVRDLYTGPVPEGRLSVEKVLEDWRLSVLTSVDTRALTLHIREKGAMYGVLVRLDDADPQAFSTVLAWLAAVPPMEARDFVGAVGAKTTSTHAPAQSGGMRFALVDYGEKQSIQNQLLSRGVTVDIVPPRTSAKELLHAEPSYDAIFLSNGPGDPAVLIHETDIVRSLMGKIPVLGICLGHQLIGKALGGTTSKMKFGHHGGNQPVRETESGRVMVTCQNHGYQVDAESLPESTVITYVNANDGTVEGLKDEQKGVISVQFHPEASPGPWDARRLFDDFIAFAHAWKTRQGISHGTRQDTSGKGGIHHAGTN
ncbi:glutamine-hydrolyzing carbamoyl-phosphate synthase small subunit [Parasphaerochaeta coccoides]|uniref:Carbamoyl phosphate synthase small chain n=1 Tax=Parasphaerochaeta coccoides (strain ATCC BAA-1237 / DSM 17374 / SPN1) TaxID=760011 RepID=F4GL98_PARC1|nr:glutamine-hydrolyzing carbamoyl-phosphate synthase small subunit [Parasphaerochaeta coccoides]AEC02930.1 carbamoyl-phosphate synthase, small subunit [Parasphaerochaeta coccoides DSM 17374]